MGTPFCTINTSHFHGVFMRASCSRRRRGLTEWQQRQGNTEAAQVTAAIREAEACSSGTCSVLRGAGVEEVVSWRLAFSPKGSRREGLTSLRLARLGPKKVLKPRI